MPGASHIAPPLSVLSSKCCHFALLSRSIIDNIVTNYMPDRHMSTTNSSPLTIDAMNGDSAVMTCSMEMRQKPHHPLSFLGRRAVAPRPLSESTDFFDTDNEAWDDDYSTKQSLETVSKETHLTWYRAHLPSLIMAACQRPRVQAR
jgi:hypothetical protein